MELIIRKLMITFIKNIVLQELVALLSRLTLWVTLRCKKADNILSLILQKVSILTTNRKYMITYIKNIVLQELVTLLSRLTLWFTLRCKES
jgi:hypothetical protein